MLLTSHNTVGSYVVGSNALSCGLCNDVNIVDIVVELIVPRSGNQAPDYHHQAAVNEQPL